jgi:PHD/YefM family antitoxin component YafN of YafNO toxin-antitoxin module
MQRVPIKRLRSAAESLLNELKKEKTALVTDKDGRPAAYLIDSVTFEGLQARLRLLEGIARGEKAIQEGRVLTHSQAKKKMARWLKAK